MTAGRSFTCWAEFKRISMQTVAGMHFSKQAATLCESGVDLTRRGRSFPLPWRPSPYMWWTNLQSAADLLQW